MIWGSTFQFSGSTASTSYLTIHTSSLVKGHRPHPPHSHSEEEFLLMLEGEADIHLPDHPEGSKQRMRLKSGEFAYYPAHFHHTLETVSQKSAVYTMFKWFGPESNPNQHLSFEHKPMLPPMAATQNRKTKQSQLIFEGPSRFLAKLRAHATKMPPGAGRGSVSCFRIPLPPEKPQAPVAGPLGNHPPPTSGTE